jgi:transcriptional regulator with XRE-family HTH domain
MDMGHSVVQNHNAGDIGMEAKTPWQRAFAKFGMTQAELAREMGRDRSKLSKAINEDDGLISALDQVKLLKVAKRCGVDLRPEDLVPQVQ